MTQVNPTHSQNQLIPEFRPRLFQNTAEAHRAATMARAFACEAFPQVGGTAIQVFGGIGFTWEHDMHLWMKRVKLDEMLFGSPSWHRRRLADAVFPRLMTT